MKFPIRKILWKSSWRVIPSYYPDRNLFERVAEPDDLEAVVELERLTSDREGSLKRKLGEDYVKAAFAYRNPEGSRFSPPPPHGFGVYYTAHSLDTAIHETRHHTEKFLRATDEKPMSLGRRVLVAEVQGLLHDLRGLKSQMPDVFSPVRYAASQKLAQELWEAGSSGLVYESVRHPGGQCAALFRSETISHCRQERFMIFEWNGRKVQKVYQLQEYPRLD